MAGRIATAKAGMEAAAGEALSQPAAAELASRLRAARAKMGMTRKQLATASGASERYLANIEQGKGNPSYSLMSALAAAMDMALAELLPLGGEQNAARAEAAAALRRLPEKLLATALDGLRRPLKADHLKRRRIVLIGMRGAGKSALGKILADRLGLPFLEISYEVERAYGARIGVLLDLSGQVALRRYERDAWDGIVATREAAVIGAPGGIVADPAFFDRVLETAYAIWLQATPEDHMSRVMAQGDFRPMASNRDAMNDLKAILSARAADYARADGTLNTSAQDFDSTVARLETLARTFIGKTAI